MKTFIGVVKSLKMAKTAVVKTETKRPHPLYKKMVKKTKKYLVHIDNQELKVGDVIKFKETRPISKRKKWIFLEKINSYDST